MRARDLIPLCSGNSEFVADWRENCLAWDVAEDEWIKMLRSRGIKAAHPDDGWVDRDKNTLFFCYPQFNDGAKAGDKVALGWPDDYRIVLLTKEIKGLLLNRWAFVDYQICK